MATPEFDAPAYLDRLNLPSTVPPTVKGLRAMQQAHFFSIPFENFDIQLGRGINLDPAHLFHKLVRLPRGGYCFELNGLFLMALHAFGFEARPLLGRVHLTGTPSGRGHQISLVDTEGGQWIVDVGFGKNTPRIPLLLEWGTIQDCNGQSYRLVDGKEFGTMLQQREQDEWNNLYSFDMEHVCPADIDYGNHFTSTNPGSFFTTARVAMKPLHDGMAVLHNNRLTLSRDGQETMTKLLPGREYMDGLKTHFGIELDAAYEDLRPVDR